MKPEREALELALAILISSGLATAIAYVLGKIAS